MPMAIGDGKCIAIREKAQGLRSVPSCAASEVSIRRIWLAMSPSMKPGRTPPASPPTSYMASGLERGYTLATDEPGVALM